MSPSRATTAPTFGFGEVRPMPRPASSMARARSCWSVAVTVCKGRSGYAASAGPTCESVHSDDRAGAAVGHRVEVERPVEVEAHRLVALPVGRDPVGDPAPGAQ